MAHLEFDSLDTLDDEMPELGSGGRPWGLRRHFRAGRGGGRPPPYQYR